MKISYSHFQNMSDIPPWIQSMGIVDLTAPLSNLDVAKILMKYIDHRIDENNIEERLHTDDKLKSIIDTLASLAKAFRVTTDTHETMISDLSLKINTVSVYFEHLIANLRSGLHEAFSRIGADIKQIITKISSSTSQSKDNMNHNIVNQLCTSDQVPLSRPHCASISSKTSVQESRSPSTTTATVSCSPTSRKERVLDGNTYNYCNICGLSVSDNAHLHLHTQLYHGVQQPHSPAPIEVLTSPTVNLQNNKCYKCDKTFQQYSGLRKHVETDHKEVHADESDNSYSEEIIPQLDGPLPDVSHLVTHRQPGPSLQVASFQFNQEKQTQKIVNDAAIPDYEINVNNDDQNATVKCSSGFYIQVARASLGSLQHPSVLACGGIAVTVDKIRVTNDQVGTEATKLINFSFMSDQTKIGGVTVHLHHSNRTIQIQGSAKMPDSSRAALWFLNHFILVRFKEQAKAKSFAIKSTNTSIIKASTNLNNKIGKPQSQNNSCSSCNRGFNSSSKPSMCSFCAKFFHKTNCIKNHMKICHRGSQLPMQTQTTVTSSIPPTPSSLTSSSTTSTEAALGHSTSYPAVTRSVSSSTPPSSNVSTDSNLSSQTVPITTPVIGPSLPPVPPAPPMDTSLSSRAVLFVPSTSSSSLPPVTTNSEGSTKSSKKKQKPFIPVSADQARNEFLQAELAAAQARIVQLDASVIDKDQTISILNARLKIFEDEKTRGIHNKYFQSSACSLSSQCNPKPSPAQHHLCCQHPPIQCCQASPHHRQSSHDSPEEQSISASVQSSIVKLEEKIETLAADTRSVQHILEKLIMKNNLPADEECITEPTLPGPYDNPIPSANETIESVEEFIFDNEDEEPLNFQDLTNQY